MSSHILAFDAQVLADSVNPWGDRLATLQLTYPRSIHSELLTHRMFSRNSASSRAIPLQTMIKNVTTSPFLPHHWGRMQTGMQADFEVDEATKLEAAAVILRLRDEAVNAVRDLERLGLHKQVGNRYLEPWMWITVIVSSTSWLHFKNLRVHPDAEPHFQKIAALAMDVLRASRPKEVDIGGWHLPLIGFEGDEELTLDEKVKVSCGRCARVSYLTHAGTRDPKQDIDLYYRLRKNGHFSPLEHVATPVLGTYGNFTGWKQERHFIPHQFVPDPKYSIEDLCYEGGMSL